ncbi:unnamed protein product [Ambrosiozyma monospora]|uniref:Unnamed protein product n=1 Tax=Ambrosiozyma monospora TaxID=43982 RepID=A0A9W7DDF3_AMBMO|nr:unnamed protein product [Ambrosiozyma monospora]
MNKAKIDFSALKRRREQIAKFKAIITDIPTELGFLIWKFVVIENLTFSDIIQLVKDDSPLNTLIFEILTQNCLVFDMDHHKKIVATLENIPGYLSIHSGAIAQLRRVMEKNSLRFCEVRSRGRIYKELQDFDVPTVFDKSTQHLIDLSEVVNIDILEPNFDLSMWMALKRAHRIHKTSFIFNTLNDRELADWEQWLPELTNLKELNVRFQVAIVQRNLKRILKALASLKSLEKLEINIFASLRDLGGMKTTNELKEFAASAKKKFTTTFIYNAHYSAADPKPEQTIIPLADPLKKLISIMEIRVTKFSTTKFDFLGKYTELEEIRVGVSELNESSNRLKVRRMKSLNGIPFSFPKLKILHLYGFAVSQKLFRSFPDSLTYLLMRDCVPTDVKSNNYGKLKFPTGLRTFRLEISNEGVNKFPIIENTKDLTSMRTVEIFSYTGNYIDNATRSLPLSFLKSLPETLQTFDFNTDGDESDYNWNSLTFAPLKNVQRLIFYSAYVTRRACVIPKWNLNTVPNKLTYLKLRIVVKNYIGTLNTPDLRELYIDLGDTNEDFVPCANRIISGLNNLQFLTLETTVKHFKRKILDLRMFNFNQLTDLTLKLVDIDFPLVSIRIPDLPINFTKLQLDFVDNESNFIDAQLGRIQYSGPIDHILKIITTKMSARVRNCQISACKGEPISLVQE